MASMNRRPKGEGSVFSFTDSRGNQKWRAESWLPPDSDGKRHRVSGTGTTRDEAISRLALNRDRRLKDPNRSKPPVTPAPPRKAKHRKKHENPTLKWYVSEYLQWHSEVGNAKETVRKKDYRTLKLHAIDYIGNYSLAQLTTKAIHKFWVDLEEDLTDFPGALRNTYKALNTALNYACKNTIINENPLRVVTPPKGKSKDIDPETMQQWIDSTLALNSYLSEPDETGKRRYESDPCAWARLMLALQGLRPSEALGLTWDRVNLDADPPNIRISHVLDRDVKTGKLIIREGTKTQRNRSVALDDETIHALKLWKTKQDQLRKHKKWAPNKGLDNLVVTQTNGKPIDQNTDRENFTALLKQSCQSQTNGIVDKGKLFPVGKLRGISCTIRLDAGANPALTATAYGHSLEVQQKHYYRGQLKAQVRDLIKAEGKFGIHSYADSQQGTQKPV